jgi:hypothetical protein
MSRKKSDLYSYAGRQWLEREYVQLSRSTYELAEQQGVSQKTIVRALKHHGLPIRDKSEAQKAALKSGRHPHPRRKKSDQEKE